MSTQYQLSIPKSKISNPDELEERLEDISARDFQVEGVVDNGDNMLTTLILDYPLPSWVGKRITEDCC